jgi:WD40 repeat protein
VRRADGAIPPRPSRRAIPTRSATSRLCLAGSSSPHRGIRPCAAHAELPPRHTATPALRFSVTGHCRVRRGPRGRMQAKVWTNDTVAATLAGHEAAVWSVAVTPDSLVLTGSADRTIKMWQSNGYEPGLAHSVVTDAEWRSHPGEPPRAGCACARSRGTPTACARWSSSPSSGLRLLETTARCACGRTRASASPCSTATKASSTRWCVG